MKFFVYSRQEIEAIEPHVVSHVIVSIRTPGDPNEVKLPMNEHTKDVLHLQFHDVDRIIQGYNENLEPEMFQPEHAKLIREFVESNKNVERFIVHCDAGWSRSPAVAAAISKMLTNDDVYFFNRYHPNRRVYNMILNDTSYKDEDISP